MPNWGLGDFPIEDYLVVQIREDSNQEGGMVQIIGGILLRKKTVLAGTKFLMQIKGDSKLVFYCMLYIRCD